MTSSLNFSTFTLQHVVNSCEISQSEGIYPLCVWYIDLLYIGVVAKNVCILMPLLSFFGKRSIVFRKFSLKVPEQFAIGTVQSKAGMSIRENTKGCDVRQIARARPVFGDGIVTKNIVSLYLRRPA